MDQFDIAIVGAGVIGLAIAARLTSTVGKPPAVVLLEKEDRFGSHTSSRNSEVIHAGIYYPAESLKAKFCVRGRQMLYDHCLEHHVPHKKTGKLIVAQSGETEELERLFNNASDCGVSDLEWLDKAQLKKLEPELQARAALLSPSTGIIDSHSLMLSLLHQAQSQGTIFSANTEFVGAEPGGSGFMIRTVHPGENDYRFQARALINCCGLDAGGIASRIQGLERKSIPVTHFCKGDYFTYQHKSPFSHLIYPVPDRKHTVLGIHGTLDMAGRLRFGPDARYILCPDYMVDEKKATHFSTAVSRYFPSIRSSDLQPAYAGVRPRLTGPAGGFADFVIQTETDHGLPGLIQLFGIESPGLSSCLAIADCIAGKLDIH
ncbi:MAG: NAD(P)/FAD-dependent oxidoreductase [Pseudohongiellaceae bacterium]